MGSYQSVVLFLVCFQKLFVCGCLCLLGHDSLSCLSPSTVLSQGLSYCVCSWHGTLAYLRAFQAILFLPSILYRKAGGAAGVPHLASFFLQLDWSLVGHSHKFSATFLPACLAGRTACRLKVSRLGWCPNPPTGSLAWLQSHLAFSCEFWGSNPGC